MAVDRSHVSCPFSDASQLGELSNFEKGGLSAAVPPARGEGDGGKGVPGFKVEGQALCMENLGKGMESQDFLANKGVIGWQAKGTMARASLQVGKG